MSANAFALHNDREMDVTLGEQLKCDAWSIVCYRLATFGVLKVLRIDELKNMPFIHTAL